MTSSLVCPAREDDAMAATSQDKVILGEMERIRQIYCDDVLRHRNREVSLAGRRCQPQILYTFLGYELKMGRKRLTCPDMSTARYLKVFAQIGMKSIRLPYDPTHTQILVDGLEHSLNRIHETLLTRELDRKGHQRAVARIYREIRRRCSCEEEPA